MPYLSVLFRVCISCFVLLVAGVHLLPVSAATPGFRVHRMDDRIQNTACAIGPDGHLYVISMNYHEQTGSAKVVRYFLQEDGYPTGKKETVYDWGPDSAAQPIGLAFDPSASKDHLIAWIALGESLQGHSGWSDPWAGRIYRAEFPTAGSSNETSLQLKITHLPHAFHTVNNITFGPDKRLYICTGSTTTLGWEPHTTEVLLSCAILQADVDKIQDVLDVKTSDGGTYNPFAPDALVKLYGTAIRQPYDCTWHPSGRLYACTNQNDVNGNTGAGGSIPNVANVRPPEFLAIIEPGKTYGFPNASRGEFVLMGGNPTAGDDGWTEIEEYPVGITPPDTFDVSLLHKIDEIGGGSANGILSYRTPGALQGRIICCFYSSEKIYTFTVSQDGRVIDREPLNNEHGEPMVIQNPLDIFEHPTQGHLYVAAYGKQDKGEGGAVYFLERTEPLQTRPELYTNPAVIMGEIIEGEENWSNAIAVYSRTNQSAQYQLTTNVEWLKIDPPSGTIHGTQNVNEHQVYLTKPPKPGTHYAKIKISSNDKTAQSGSLNLYVEPLSNQNRFFVSAGNSYEITAVDFPVKLPLKGTVISAVDQVEVSSFWEVESGNPNQITLPSENVLTGTATIHAPGQYRLRLVAKQGNRTRQARVTFTVDVPNNKAPTLKLTASRKKVKIGEVVQLSASAQDDGLPKQNHTLSYQWTREGTGAGIVTFSDPQGKSTEARFSQAAPYRIRCTVSDGVRSTHHDIEMMVAPAE